jgi:hypothetical protein
MKKPTSAKSKASPLEALQQELRLLTIKAYKTQEELHHKIKLLQLQMAYINKHRVTLLKLSNKLHTELKKL